ncbi:putative ubiquitin fusion degradation protein Ufd1 [Helianthus annuus]|uniref:Ubiquitin fusion degradation protein Ufd1 n=1 Tax=Helianthus annuus TaxID=4232 RepID=A0A9K3EDL8_HELAN|nr:ubiquitin fusion degradation protein 1 homolog [Helianthus annuus]KAF5770948.1 putative ubiquitin fusion degradation protein Ufd1 [Helianthus annuus]KAJ0465802.1 putative ubiquitin fusion degradation protein Ufd1 [Helianthus annuus]KAJ0470713.1 putative ubiquitin fusion degradation protein Ufd1 [Helianthus annuus]KAJ0487392.1 putative ubiquitin fusion degradation protein Ufd1 [Helianthus annuus]KAJ0657834.1 putative ubiquitin fusion degradation protein Ufd1 [Helianthus annuus]
MDNWDTWDDIEAYQTHTGNTFSSSITPTDFDQYYISYPLSHISKTIHETGNKIIMPASALNQLASLSISYPMLFRIENTAVGLHSHCGVIEFTADEGFVFMPTWMMNNLHLQEGELVNIKNTSLPKGEYIKIQPHATKFTTLSDHKSLLEKAFRDYVCLTTGDTIVINHGGDKYMIDIVETKPSPAILLFETDCVVDFAQPLDYKEPEKKTTKDDEDPTTKKDCKLFPGVGRRLGGRVMKKIKMTESNMVVDEKLEKKHETLFKPFSGVARRVDGQPLAAAVADDHPNIHVDARMNEEGFNAFTGKSYRLL